ncbi:MAG: hypothetical protein ACUVTL_00560 [Thermoproteota archaeon]
MALIDLYGSVRMNLEKELIDSLSRCKNLKEILSILLNELRDDPDFGRPESIQELQRYFLFLINGSPTDPLEFDRELGDNEKVTILPLSHGG